MSNDTTQPIESIARKPLVGTDGQGRQHRFDSYRDQIYVLDTQETHVEHVEQLRSGELSKWIAFVRRERGWEDVHYSGDDTFSSLVRRLENRMEGRR